MTATYRSALIYGNGEIFSVGESATVLIALAIFLVMASWPPCGSLCLGGLPVTLMASGGPIILAFVLSAGFLSCPVYYVLVSGQRGLGVNLF